MSTHQVQLEKVNPIMFTPIPLGQWMEGLRECSVQEIPESTRDKLVEDNFFDAISDMVNLGATLLIRSDGRCYIGLDGQLFRITNVEGICRKLAMRPTNMILRTRPLTVQNQHTVERKILAARNEAFVKAVEGYNVYCKTMGTDSFGLSFSPIQLPLHPVKEKRDGGNIIHVRKLVTEANEEVEIVETFRIPANLNEADTAHFEEIIHAPVSVEQLKERIHYMAINPKSALSRQAAQCVASLRENLQPIASPTVEKSGFSLRLFVEPFPIPKSASSHAHKLLARRISSEHGKLDTILLYWDDDRKNRAGEAKFGCSPDDVTVRIDSPCGRPEVYPITEQEAYNLALCMTEHFLSLGQLSRLGASVELHMSVGRTVISIKLYDATTKTKLAEKKISHPTMEDLESVILGFAPIVESCRIRQLVHANQFRLSESDYPSVIAYEILLLISEAGKRGVIKGTTVDGVAAQTKKQHDNANGFSPIFTDTAVKNAFDELPRKMRFVTDEVTGADIPFLETIDVRNYGNGYTIYRFTTHGNSIFSKMRPPSLSYSDVPLLTKESRKEFLQYKAACARTAEDVLELLSQSDVFSAKDMAQLIQSETGASMLALLEMETDRMFASLAIASYPGCKTIAKSLAQ